MNTFELHRADLPKRRMSAPGIVEHFNVVEDVSARECARGVRLSVDAFLFERGEETLDRGVDAPMSSKPC